MKFKYKIALIVMSISYSVHGQDTLKLSLKEAQNIGLQKRFDLNAKKFDMQLAKNEITTKKMAYMPDIKATGNIHYSPQIQATLIPPGFGGLAEATIVQLGAKSSSIFSLELNQQIYNPTHSSDMSLAKINYSIEQEKYRLQEKEVKEQISYAYLNVMLRKLQYEIAIEEEKRYSDYAGLATGKYNSGTLLENDFLRAKLDYENSQLQSRISKQNLEQSYMSLRYRLNVSDTLPILITDNFNELNGLPDIYKTEVHLEDFSEYKLLKLNEEHNNVLIAKQNRALLPTVSLYGNYSAQYLNTSFNYDYTENKWWSNYNGVGIRISIPITTAIVNRPYKQNLCLEGKQLSSEIEQKKQDLRYEISSAEAELNNAYENYLKSLRNYDLAKSIYANQSKQLQIGTFSYDSILITENSVIQSEKNFVEATYAYMMAKLKYDIATDNI